MDSKLKTKLKNTLRDKLPEFQRNDDLPITQYVDAAGEMLDELRETIHSLSGYLNWNDAPIDRIDSLGTSFGFEFPRNLAEATRRTIVRDIVNIYKRNGTPDTFRWIFKIIGWDVELQYAWLLNPEKTIRGLKKNIYNGEFLHNGTINYGEERRIDLENFNYRDFLYGESQVDEDGTFFYGKQYFDSENLFNKIPIQGEYYPHRRIAPDDPIVAATPYVIVRIQSADYRLFTDPYVDPDTGIEYSYTDSERFQIAEELINFLLYDQGRPVHVRVVIIVTDDQLSDEIEPIEEDLTQIFTGWLDEFDDEMELEDESVTTFDIDGALKIGDDYKIGWCNPITKVSVLSSVKIGEPSQSLLPLPLDEYEIKLYLDLPGFEDTLTTRRYIMRAGTNLSFEVPAFFTVSIYGIDTLNPDATSSYEFVDSFGEGQSVDIDLDDYHAIYFVLNNTLQESDPEMGLFGGAPFNEVQFNGLPNGALVNQPKEMVIDVTYKQLTSV